MNLLIICKRKIMKLINILSSRLFQPSLRLKMTAGRQPSILSDYGYFRKLAAPAQMLAFITSFSITSLLGNIDEVGRTHGNLTEPTEFVIVVLSYNNENKWAERNLDSLINQRTSRPYRIICVNDCSSDKTGAIMDNYVKKHKLPESFVKLIHNKKRVGALANLYNTVHEQCKDHEVVVLMDGDDALAHRNILARLEKEYSDPDLWLTYWQFVFYPGAQWGTVFEITREQLEKRLVRTIPYVSQHLRTFKAGLFKKIQKEHLMANGEFFSMNADMATMIPMLEMCAPKDASSPMHCKFIPDILYIYNYVNPISDFRVDRPLQLELEKVIRAIKPYEPLDML